LFALISFDALQALSRAPGFRALRLFTLAVAWRSRATNEYITITLIAFLWRSDCVLSSQYNYIGAC
jgi:hypothetical protein